MLTIEVVFALWLAGRVRKVLAAVDKRAHDLILLAELLDRLEREPFQSCCSSGSGRRSRPKDTRPRSRFAAWRG